jgi:hypothetical protein
MAGRGGAEPGPYWGLVRVERKEHKGAQPRVLQEALEAGTVGAAEDRALCLFCGGEFSAQPNRIMGQFALVGVAGQHPPLGVMKCKGPQRGDNETERDYDGSARLRWQRARRQRHRGGRAGWSSGKSARRGGRRGTKRPPHFNDFHT